MGDEMFGGGMNSGGLNSGLNANMNSDIAKQMSLLSAAGRLRATSAGGPGQQPQQQQQPMNRPPMGMAPPVPPNVPDKQRAQFLAMLSQVLLHKNIVLPPFVTGQPNPAWNPDVGPLKHVQPATDNRLGALRLPGAAPGRAGDIDLFKLWSAVTGAGGMQRISSAGQWDAVAAHIGLQLSPLPGSSHPPAAQLAQLYFMLLSPLEEHMKQRSAQAKQAQAQAQMQALAAQQQQQQNPGQAHPQQLLTPAQMHQQQNAGAGLGMQNPALGGMQNPALGGMQNNLGGMQNALGGMQNSAMGVGVGGMQNPAALGGMQNPAAALGGMQNPMQANLGMQNPALGGMQNNLSMANNLGMQNGLGMQNTLGINAMNALNPAGAGQMQMTPAQMHQQQQQNQATGVSGVQGGAMLTPAQLHAMQNGNGAGPGGAGVGVGVGGMGGAGVAGMGPAGVGPGVGGLGGPAVNGLGGAGVAPAPGVGGGAMPPPAPVLPTDPMGLGIASSKRKSEPDEDEKRAKLKVGDPAAATPGAPSAPATTSRRTKIEYVPLRLDVETYGGRALDGMLAGVGAQGSMERPIRDISELGVVDINALILSLRARTPRALGYALGTLSALSAHSQQSFPLVRCEDLVDVLVDILESAAWEGEGWAGGILGHEDERDKSPKEESKPRDAPVKKESSDEAPGPSPVEELPGDMWDEDVPIRTHRELVRIAAEMGLGMRVRGHAWDGGVVSRHMKKEGESDDGDGDVKMEPSPGDDPELYDIYGDIAPPGIARSDVIITIVRLLRNFCMGPENCAFMAREGSRVVEVLAGIVGFREGKGKGEEDELPELGDDPIGFVNGSWDGGVEISIAPLSSALNLSQLLRVRKDVLHIIASLALQVRLNPSTPTPRRLFALIASFLLDPADTRTPVQLYQHLLPHRRFSLTTDLALDAISRLAHADANRAVLQRTVPPVLLRATFAALIRMLPAEPNDMVLLMRAEPWMAYAERLALAVYALACCLPGSVRRVVRTQRAMGAAVLRMMCRMAQYDPAAGVDKGVGGWTQRSPFACLVRRVIEALRIIDEPEEGSAGEVIGWPVRGAKVEGGKGAGWLAGVGAEDALVMMVIEGMDPVTFEDLEVLTRVGEVGA